MGRNAGGAARPQGLAGLAPYFKHEWRMLALVSVTGILYNVGMVVGPWMEGQLAQQMANVLAGTSTAWDMTVLGLAYVAAIAFVQGMRALKRLFVRKFANNVSRRMKRTLYANLLQTSQEALRREGVGQLMTKALADVDDCSEGMRKFTTEIFDTGVLMVVYLVTLLALDWRTTLIAMVFPPISYLIASRMRGPVTRASAAAKQSVSTMAAQALDRVEGALTYRTFGLEQTRDQAFEATLSDYEAKERRANVLSTALMPLYQAISLMGAAAVMVLEARNVMGQGWVSWDIAAFATYFSVITRLAVKSSHAAKLFNAVQRATVSWNRISEYMGEPTQAGEQLPVEPARLVVDHVGLSWTNERTEAEAIQSKGANAGKADQNDGQLRANTSQPLFHDVSFAVSPGEVIGITGEVACGKSILGSIVCGELAPTSGNVILGHTPVRKLVSENRAVATHLSHDAKLVDDTICQNVLLGAEGEPWSALRDACLDTDVRELPEGINTQVGAGGAKLSGGQRSRLGLARSIQYLRPITVLDDPFASVDLDTEQRGYGNLIRLAQEQHVVIVLISHRLLHFRELSGVVCMHDGTASFGSHEELLRECPAYARLYELQNKGGVDLDQR